MGCPALSGKTGAGPGRTLAPGWPSDVQDEGLSEGPFLAAFCGLVACLVAAAAPPLAGFRMLIVRTAQ